VTTTPYTREARATGTAWLAQTAPDPAAVLRAWDEGAPAAVAPQPHTWRALEAPLSQSLDAATILLPTGNLGPVLRSTEERRAWWLVAAGTATILAGLPGTTVRPDGWALTCPPPGIGAGGRSWLHPPYGTGLLTPACLLREALLRAQAMAR
jgi:hypothetical protein